MDKETSTKGEAAVEIFELVVKNKLLPTTINKLIPLSFIGQTAVNFYRDKIKLMDQLEMTEEQRKATLKDGQEAGELLLNIETRIGEIALKESRIPPFPRRKEGKGTLASGKPPKHKRLGMDLTRMQRAQTIAKHPEAVATIIRRAKDMDDIPTKTAVLSEIKYRKEKKKNKQSKQKVTPNIDQYVLEIVKEIGDIDVKLAALRGQTEYIATLNKETLKNTLITLKGGIDKLLKEI